MEQSEIVAALTEYFHDEENSDIVVAYLFGSTARGRQSSFSDVDIGVLFASDADEMTRVVRRIKIGQELESLLSCPVDIVDLDLTPPHFNHQVLRHKVVLKGQNASARVAFEKSVKRQYFDMLPYRRRYVEARLARLREGGLSRGGRTSHQGTLAAARRIHRRLAGRTGR